jgi:hypothetical protein
MLRISHWLVWTLLIGTATGASSSYALAAGTEAKGERPAKLEAIPGSDLKKVVLLPRAAERLAIQTATVREEPVLRWLMVGGTIESVGERQQQKPAATADAGTVIPASATPDDELVRVRAAGDSGEKIRQAVLVLSLASAKEDDDDGADGSDVSDGDEKAKAVFVVPIGGQSGKKSYRASRSKSRPAEPMRSTTS